MWLQEPGSPLNVQEFCSTVVLPSISVENMLSKTVTMTTETALTLLLEVIETRHDVLQTDGMSNDGIIVAPLLFIFAQLLNECVVLWDCLGQGHECKDDLDMDAMETGKRKVNVKEIVLKLLLALTKQFASHSWSLDNEGIFIYFLMCLLYIHIYNKYLKYGKTSFI